MRKPAILVLTILLSAIISNAQNSSIKGTVTDSVEKKNPVNAVISIMRQSDSVLVKFSRAGNDGSFSVSGLEGGNYIVMVTHPFMGDYFDVVTVAAGETKNMGRLYMTPKSKLLTEVLLKTGTPIRIKGDTTVYTADSFKVRPGANVEELLRRLPGIQVDKDGKITAMGERVKKVLVDGEEFFGSDPGIATKNLRADAVKEVEVFDKKSDQAEFTGIDDGVKDKTINLKMKKKEGYFGKLELGGGLKDKYNNSLMLNSFKDKRKLAGYGIMSNTGQTNLDWQDAQNYGGGSDNMQTGVDDGGGMWISMTRDEDENFYGGRNGIPQNWNGGIHFSDKFGMNDKQSFNSGYKFTKVNAPGMKNTFSKVFLPDSAWSTNTFNNTFSSTIKHAVNMTIDLNLDSANSLKWTTRANKRNGRTSNDLFTESFTEVGDSINNSKRFSSGNTETKNLTSTLLWRHKFKKLSRTLSVNTDFTWNQSDNKSLLYSLNKYYQGGAIANIDTIDQMNDNNSDATGLVTKIAYTEPLGKDFYMELSHSIAWNKNTNERITNVKSSNGKYEDVIDSLSNNFVFDRVVNTPGLNFRMNKKKYNYSFGASVGFSRFLQENVTAGTKTKYNFTNFFPRASYTYKFKPSQNLRFNYNGSTTAPTLEQLQPIRVNTDPLNEYIGNPDLDQSFTHSFSVGYNSYNVLKEKNVFTNLSLNFRDNAFVQSSRFVAGGKRTIQTVNADGAYNINLYSDYGFKMKNKIRLGVGPTFNLNRNIDFVDGVKNVTTTRNMGVRLNVSKFKDNKYDFWMGPSITFNRSRASLNPNANADFWQLEGWANGRVVLPKNFEISSDMNVQIRQKDPRFTQNNNITIWNAAIIKRFLKDNKLEAKFGIYDILNQNKGYQRDFSSSSFTESYFNTLQRFWLLTLTWNISKNGKPASGW